MCDVEPAQADTPTGVRRVNNVPVYLVGGVMVGFLLIMLLVAMDRAETPAPELASGKDVGGNSSVFAKSLVGDRQDGETPPEIPLEVHPPLDPASAGTVPLVASTPPPASTIDPDAERIHADRLRLLEQGIRARSTVNMAPPRSPGATPSPPGDDTEALLAHVQAAQDQAEAATSEDPATAYRARLAQLRAAGLAVGSGRESAGAGAGGNGSASAAPSVTGGRGLSTFDRQTGGDRWQHEAAPQAPRSRYELRAGFVIPAIMISGINSDLPGQVIAQVSQDVTDTSTGRFLLIPRGARLVGSYTSEIAYGQSRLFIAWQRIVFPDGKALDIGAMPGSDSAGYAGFNDQVNNHYLRLYASAFLLSGVTAAITLSQDRSSSNLNQAAPNAGNALSEALGQQLGQVTAQLIARNMNISPTLEIRPGYRFNVMVVKDLTFAKPYQPFDY